MPKMKAANSPRAMPRSATRHRCKEIAPNLKRAALLINPKSAPYYMYFVRAAETEASALGIEPVFSPIENEPAGVERMVGWSLWGDPDLRPLTAPPTNICSIIESA
jgi:hypothetical protein